MNPPLPLALLLLWLALSLTPAGPKARAAGSEPQQKAEEFAERIQALNAQVVVRTQEDLKNYTPERVAALTGHIQKLLTDYLVNQFDSTDRISGPLLAQQLRSFQGKYALPAEVTNTPYVLAEPFKGGVAYIVAYLIYRGGDAAPDTKAVIQVFIKQTQGFALRAETGTEFDRHGLFIVPIIARRRRETWFLAYGTRFGDNGSRLAAVLYSFDGSSLGKLWARSGLPRAGVKISPQGLELTYLDRRRYTKATPPYFRTEKYRFTEKGLELSTPPTN